MMASSTSDNLTSGALGDLKKTIFSQNAGISWMEDKYSPDWHDGNGIDS